MSTRSSRPRGRQGGPDPRRSGNPARRAQAHQHGGSRTRGVRSASARSTSGRRSRRETALAWLRRRPHWLLPLVTVVLTLAGMFLPPDIGGVCLLAVAALLGWMASLVWPRIGTGARIVRVLVIAAVVGVAVARLTGVWVA